MPELFIITDEWNELPWFSTGGTRAKKYLQAPNGKFYYFKRSQYKDATDTKPGKDFKYEFWSEVIGYQVGALLGFNILKYDVAVFGPVMGCISESMINSEQEELIEGLKYLQAFAPNYDPKNKEHQTRYTFQLVENALERAKLKSEINNIIEVIIFDALIGNGDRHQENWAVISHQQLITEIIEKLEKEKKIRFSRIEKFFVNIMKKFVDSNKGEKMPKSFYRIERRFAPIYDNGSSLGRELLDERVEFLLQFEDELNRYIDRGMAEIHWEGDKINHFMLIRNLLDSPLYNETVKNIINRVLAKWDGPEIDRRVPESHNVYKIPQSRKQLIFKIITLRRHRLDALIHERI